MKIDRHNYEEYFLLYIDNELPIDQKKQVELFVRENPDLQQELLMLQQLKLVPDGSVVFEDKNVLMKATGDSFINMNNYEEWLVLYADNELNPGERKEVEKFAAGHLKVREELELFCQARLQPETLVFPGKESLYRSEQVRVITMQWWKVAVAAILIIAAGITFYSVFSGRTNSKTTPGELATGNQKKQSPVVKTIPTNKQEQNIPVIKEEEQIAVTPSVNKQPATEKEKEKQPMRNEQESNQLLAVNTPGNKIEPRQHAVSEAGNEIRTTDLKIRDDVVGTHKEKFNVAPVTKTPTDPPQDYASNTDNESKKLRGFFRKATRLIERTTNINPADDDNKVLIGGMAFNLK